MNPVIVAWHPADTDIQTFAKSDLPKEHRIVPEGGMMTADHKPDR